MAGEVERTFDYLGTTIVVPPQVMPITPMSHLLGNAVLSETHAGDRVLDMGTGSGVNAILAATLGAQVLAVDVSPLALDAARSNVERNAVAVQVEVRFSVVFSDVGGRFDLVVFDPPFRWFKPRSLMESFMTDEGYQALTRIFQGGPGPSRTGREDTCLLRYLGRSRISQTADGGGGVPVGTDSPRRPDPRRLEDWLLHVSRHVRPSKSPGSWKGASPSPVLDVSFTGIMWKLILRTCGVSEWRAALDG